MKMYEKPIAQTLEEFTEGVYLASGDSGDKEEKKPCRFGRYEASATVDKCQSCSATGGLTADKKGTYVEDYKGCVDNMPEKK